MSRGVFSADFASKFEDVLNIHFEDFPSRSGEMPDPKGVVEAQDTPDSVPPDLEIPPTNASMQELPVDVFEFDFSLPETVSPKAVEHMPSAPAGFPTLSAAVSTNYGPLYAPGGGGKGKPPVEPPSEPTLSTNVDDAYVSGTPDSSGTDYFNIELQFYGADNSWSTGTAAALQVYLEEAAEFLSSIITTGFTNDTAMFNSFDTANKFEIDDLLVEVYIAPLSGVVAAATEVYAANDWDGDGTFRDPKLETPAGAKIIFNADLIADLDNIGVLDDTALHEMMHTLLFGVWENAENDLTTKEKGKGGALIYTGESGLAQYQSDFGSGEKLLVEDEGLAGSVGGHWSEAAYDTELMTSVVENNLLDPTENGDFDIMYLSYFSVASLKDLAVVNSDDSTGYQLADDWQAQVDALNSTADNEIGIDLDAWAVSTLA